MKHLVNLVDEMNHKKMGFKVLSGAEIDTTTANGRLVFGIFAALAEFERELIRERTQAGLQRQELEVVTVEGQEKWMNTPLRWLWPR